MSRRGKFFDKRSDSQAFGEGRHTSKKAGFLEDIKQVFRKGLDKTVSDTRSRQEKAYDAGWEDGKSLRKAHRATRTTRSKGEGGFDLQGLLISLGFIAFTIFAMYESVYNPDAGARKGAFYCAVPGLLVGAVFLIIFLLPRRK